MWYRQARTAVAEINEEQKTLLEQLPRSWRFYVETALENQDGAELLKSLFMEGADWNPVLDQLFPDGTAARAYAEAQEAIGGVPLHRRKVRPRFLSPEVVRQYLGDIASGRAIGEGEDDLSPAFVERLTDLRPLSGDAYRDMDARQSGILLEPIPQQILYHTTTNLPGVLAQGKLLSRSELAQAEGGLGGGSAETVSLTTNRQYAHNIACALVFMSQVARGEISYNDLMQQAEQGEGAEGPYDTLLKQNALELEPLRTGIQRTTSWFGPPRGEGWKEVERGTWERPLSEEDALDARAKLARTFLMARSEAGGMDDPFFGFSNNQALAAMNPSNIAVLKLQVAPGARGQYLFSEMEWRVHSGGVLQIVDIEKPDCSQALSKDASRAEVRKMAEQYLKGWG